MRKNLFIIITLVLGVLILTTPKSIRAADNMCNVNPGSCTSDAEWVSGWFAAREPENVSAAPQQTEWTNASQPEPEVIRVANEDNSVNRSQVAADDAAARGGDPVNPSTVTETTPPPGGCPSGTIPNGVTCKLSAVVATTPVVTPASVTPGTGVGGTSSANLTPVPANTSGGEGTCTAGPNHEYNECCGEGRSRKVIRSCNNSGGFVYAVSACDIADGACGDPNANTNTSCPTGSSYVNGSCYSSGSCNPSCPATTTCGQADGCSGVCTNKCGSQEEANRVSAVGPTAGPNGGIINGGNSDSNACSGTTGVCQAGSGQTIQQCNCNGLSNNQGSTGVCTQNCRTVTGSVDCQAQANSSCQAVQLDVLNSSGGVVDTVVCLPPAGCTAPTGGGPTVTTTPGGGGDGGNGGGGNGGGGGGTTTTTTGGGGGTAAMCVETRVYLKKADGTFDTVTTPIAQLSSKISIGNVIRLAIRGNLANFTKGRFIIKKDGVVLETKETTTKNNLPGDAATFEYIYDYTVASGGTYSIEGAVWQ